MGRETWLSLPVRVWRRHMDADPNWGVMARALRPLYARGILPEVIASYLDNYLRSLTGTPYPPNWFRFAETFKRWEHPVRTKADTFPWPDGDPRWHDPQYADQAIAYYTKGAP